MLHFNDIVFGPISSRRLGYSLGVNILPSRGKFCNFDCIYCECGWNKDGLGDKKFPTYAEVEAAMTERISALAAEGAKVDSITFSGNGEPTMHPDFYEIIDLTLRLRDKYFPQAKVSVLSNATLIGKETVFQALRRIDNPIMKIDASKDMLVQKINKPVGVYQVAEVIRNLEKFEGNFVLQTMFLRSDDFTTTSHEALTGWMDIVRRLKPREIMVYTIDRETPDKTLTKYTEDEMRAFVQPLLDEGFNIQIRG